MFLKGIRTLVLFGLPVLVDKFLVQFPEVAQLSLGALLVMLVNVLKVRVGLRIP